MGSAFSKQKVSSKVLPEPPHSQNVEREDVKKEPTVDLPPLRLRLTAVSPTVLPAISPKMHSNIIMDESPRWSDHINDDEDDDFNNALEADLQFSLDQDRNNLDEEMVISFKRF